MKSVLGAVSAPGFGLGLLIVSCIANAGQFRVAPTQLEFSGATRSASLTVTNSSATPLHMQTRVLRWRQVDGADQLQATDQLVTSPPIATVAPGAEQLVRVIALGEPPHHGEDSYRILVDELPGTDARAAGENAVRVLLRYSVPVFVQGGDALVSRPPDFVARVSAEGQLTLVAHNNGERRVRLTALTLLTPQGEVQPFGSGLLGYALGGRQRSWTAPLAAGMRLGPQLELRATTDMGEIRAQVPVVRER